MHSNYTRSNNPVLHRPIELAQYTAVAFAERLAAEGIVPSIGTGQAFDNALAETTMGLYKTEAIRDDSPFRTGPLPRLADVEALTAAWVHWYNTSRIMHRLGWIPPIEYEQAYYARDAAQSAAAHT